MLFWILLYENNIVLVSHSNSIDPVKLQQEIDLLEASLIFSRADEDLFEQKRINQRLVECYELVKPEKTNEKTLNLNSFLPIEPLTRQNPTYTQGSYNQEDIQNPERYRENFNTHLVKQIVMAQIEYSQKVDDKNIHTHMMVKDKNFEQQKDQN